MVISAAEIGSEGRDAKAEAGGKGGIAEEVEGERIVMRHGKCPPVGRAPPSAGAGCDGRQGVAGVDEWAGT